MKMQDHLFKKEDKNIFLCSAVSVSTSQDVLFIFDFIGIQSSNNVVLVSAVQQNESVVGIHLSPLLDFLPIQVTTEHLVVSCATQQVLIKDVLLITIEFSTPLGTEILPGHSQQQECRQSQLPSALLHHLRNGMCTPDPHPSTYHTRAFVSDGGWQQKLGRGVDRKGSDLERQLEANHAWAESLLIQCS